VNDKSARNPRDLELAFVKHDLWWYMKKQPKLSLHFKIMEAGNDFGADICAHYRLDHFDKRGRTYANPKSRIVRDLGRLFPDYIKETPLPLTRLKGCVVIGRTRWVTTDGNNVPIAPQQQYEIVQCLLSRANG